MSSVLVSGNPVNGFRIIGPFEQPHHAADWASEWDTNVDWWVAPLIDPKQIEQENKHAPH